MVTLDDVHEVADSVGVFTRGTLAACNQEVVHAFSVILGRRTPGHLFRGMRECARKLRPWKNQLVGAQIKHLLNSIRTFADLFNSKLIPGSSEISVEDKLSHEMIVFLVELSSLMDVCCMIEEAPTDRLGVLLREDLWTRMRSYAETHPLFSVTEAR